MGSTMKLGVVEKGKWNGLMFTHMLVGRGGALNPPVSSRLGIPSMAGRWCLTYPTPVISLPKSKNRQSNLKESMV